MVAKTSAEGPLTGWKIDVKVKNGRKIKCYINVKSGVKLYSMASVYRYMKNGSNSSKRTQPRTMSSKSSMRNQHKHVLAKRNEYPEWLPDGWRMQWRVRNSGPRKGQRYKCYTDPSTGRVFFAQPEVSKYLDSVRSTSGSLGSKDRGVGVHSSSKSSPDVVHGKKSDAEQKDSQDLKTHEKRSSTSTRKKVLVEQTIDEGLASGGIKDTWHGTEGRDSVLAERNEYPEWLPDGWRMEWRVRNNGPRKGRRYKCFIDPSTGRVFLSKPEVSKYLESLRSISGSSGSKGRDVSIHPSSKSTPDMAREKKSDAEQKESQDSESHEKSGTSKRKEVVIEKTIDEGLPSGWIKEIHIKKTGHGTTRRDLFYIDTASGYIFRSRLDVMRFLETGVISKHAYMRKGSGITDVKLRKDEISSPSSAKGEKQVQTRAMKQRFAGEETPENSALKPSTELGESPTARPMSTSADVVINENNPVLKETEPASILVKAPSSKEKPNSGKKLSLPPRSSRRLAGVEAEVVSNSIPIERILRNKRKEHSPSEIDKLTTEKPAEPSVDVPKPVELSVDVQTPVEPSADVQKPNKKTLPETQENDITVKNPVLKRSKKPLDGKIGRCSNGKTQSNKRKPKNGTHLSLPSRSSKRLAGIEAELAVHSTPVERHLCNPSKKSDKFESTRETFAAENPSHFTESQQNGLGIASSGLFEYLNIKNEGSSSKLDRSQDQSLEVRSDPRDSKDAGAEVGLTETRECSRDQPLPQNPIASSETGTREPDHQDPNFCFPSSLWSDPCLEFAYKTLTGAIPLDDNLAIEDYVQHQLRTSTHDNINNGNSNNNNLSLQDIDLNSLFQDDAPSEFDDSNPQFQTTPVSPFTGDFGLPNYNGFRSPKSS